MCLLCVVTVYNVIIDTNIASTYVICQHWCHCTFTHLSHTLYEVSV